MTKTDSGVDETSEKSEFTYTSLGGHVGRPEELDDDSRTLSTQPSTEPLASIPATDPVTTNGVHHNGQQSDSTSMTSEHQSSAVTIITPQIDEASREEKVLSQQTSVESTQTTAMIAAAGSSFTFDELIDRLREDRISNKDVCNYILNLLVGGEFDLEKNFVIQNVTSILKMIQVIKCANPSLKVKKSGLFMPN